MAGNALFEVCGGVISGLTRSVTERLVNTNEAGLNSDSFGYDPLESTRLEWNYYPVDEFICQEYGDSEVTVAGHMTWNNVRVRVTNAFLPENNEDRTQETRDGTMGWKMFRPSLGRTIWRSLCYGFLISFLSAFSIGAFSIIIYYISYQVILVCLARHNQSAIPIKIQWLKAISDVTILVFSHFWFTLNTLFYFRPHQIAEVKRRLFVTSLSFHILNFLYRLVLQGCGIYFSVWTPLLKIPENALFAIGVCVQTWIIAKHFSEGNTFKKLKTFSSLLVCCAVTLVMGILVANFLYPAFNKQEKPGKVCIALFTPLIAVILKVISRFSVQRIWKISHPGTSFVYLIPLYHGSAVMLRFLQVDLGSVKSVALIGLIHGLSEVIERSTVVLIDYLYHKICERERITWRSYRTPRRERLATDIAIMSMLYEASAIISVNGFLHLHEYFYTYNKTCLQIIQSFVITTSVPLTIEWFFSGMSIAIETHYQNRPIFAVWRKQWKRHIIVAIINVLPIAVWSSTSLLIAIQSQFKDMKDYCEMPFTHM